MSKLYGALIPEQAVLVLEMDQFRKSRSKFILSTAVVVVLAVTFFVVSWSLK